MDVVRPVTACCVCETRLLQLIPTQSTATTRVLVRLVPVTTPPRTTTSTTNYYYEIDLKVTL
jgi:hypothetical protein